MGATPAPAATAPKKRSRIRRAASQYRHARRSLRTPASVNSRRGLDWANFFIADVQTGFGTFVAFYLASLGWSHRSVGFALGVSGLAAVLGLIPGGALADAVPWKRGLVAAGVAMICTAALILALAPTLPLVFAAMTLHGLSAGLITPTVSAISLGLVGRRGMSLRTGRNFRFSAAGTALTATLLGAIGSFLSPWAIFVAAAALCMPAVVALSYIRPEEIDYARARNASPGERARQFHRVIDLAKNRPLVLFAGCLVLFQFTNASILAADRRRHCRQRSRIGIAPPFRSDYRVAGRCRRFSSVGGLHLGTARAQTAAAGRHRAGSGSGPAARLCDQLSVDGPNPVAGWHHRRDHECVDGPDHHRPDGRERPLQSCTRRHCIHDGSCRGIERWHHWLRFSGIRARRQLSGDCRRGSDGHRHSVDFSS